MLERAERASHIDPPASSYAIMQRASPYCGENPGPGKDVRGELEPRPGIREQPGSIASIPRCPRYVRLYSKSDDKADVETLRIRAKERTRLRGSARRAKSGASGSG